MKKTMINYIQKEKVEATKKGYKVAHDGDGVDIGGRMKSHRDTVQKGLSQTLKTDCDVGVVVDENTTKMHLAQTWHYLAQTWHKNNVR